MLEGFKKMTEAGYYHDNIDYMVMHLCFLKNLNIIDLK